MTRPVYTLLDLAALGARRLEAAVNEADKLRLVDADSLRRSLREFDWHPGAPVLKRLLDRPTFVLTDSELERRFLPIVRRAGLPRPETGQRVNGFRVDFYWPKLGLSWRRTASATTARRCSRPGTARGTRRTPRPA